MLSTLGGRGSFFRSLLLSFCFLVFTKTMLLPFYLISFPMSCPAQKQVFFPRRTYAMNNMPSFPFLPLYPRTCSAYSTGTGCKGLYTLTRQLLHEDVEMNRRHHFIRVVRLNRERCRRRGHPLYASDVWAGLPLAGMRGRRFRAQLR